MDTQKLIEIVDATATICEQVSQMLRKNKIDIRDRHVMAVAHIFVNFCKFSLGFKSVVEIKIFEYKAKPK